MSLLAKLRTDVGLVRLHRTEEGFETRRRYCDPHTGEAYDCHVPQSLENAQWWFDQAEQKGVVLKGRPA